MIAAAKWSRKRRHIRWPSAERSSIPLLRSLANQNINVGKPL
jgi:hypothetical protein